MPHPRLMGGNTAAYESAPTQKGGKRRLRKPTVKRQRRDASRQRRDDNSLRSFPSRRKTLNKRTVGSLKILPFKKRTRKA